MSSLAVSVLMLAPFAFGQASGFQGNVAPAGQSSATPGVTMQGKPSAGLCSYSGSHTATIRLTVTPSGQPANEAIAVSTGNDCLDQQALKTVAGYHFNPAVKDGRPVATRIQIQVNYKRF